MTNRLTVKQDQIRAAIKAADKEGFICEISLINGSARFIHKDTQENTLDDDNDNQPNSLAEWQGKANGKN